MKKRYFVGMIAGCALLMLGCANQKKDPIDDPDMPAITDNTGITEGAEGIAGQDGSTTDQGGGSADQATAATDRGQSSADQDGKLTEQTGSSEKQDRAVDQAAVTAGNSGVSATETTEEIGIEAAKKIALTKINLTEQDGSWKEAKRDRDDGQVVYDLEFVSGKIKYEFEIDARNGKILEYQKDSIDD